MAETTVKTVKKKVVVKTASKPVKPKASAEVADIKVTTRRPRVSPKYKGKNGGFEYFQVIDKRIVIPFGEIFGDENHKFEEFKVTLAERKIYGMIVSIIAENNNTLLSYNKEVAMEVMYRYMCLKAHIDSWADDDIQPFTPNMCINQIMSLFTGNLSDSSGTTTLMDIVMEFVKMNYKGNANAAIDNNAHKFKSSTTFKDEHYIDFCTVSTMMKLVIPICTHYANMHPKVDAKRFFDQVAKSLFDIVMSITERDSYKKLHFYISSMVGTAKSIDGVMWDRIAILGKTGESKIEEIMSKVLTTIIPQIELSGNIRGYFASVIRNSATFTVRKNDPFTMHAFSDKDGKSGNDDSILTDAEIFDSYVNKPNEELRILRKYSSHDTMQIIMRRNGISISLDDFLWNHANLKIHNFQKNLIFQSFTKYFGSTDNMYDCGRATYVHLMIILNNIFRKLNLNLMAEYLTGEKTAHRHRKLTKGIEKKVFENPKYINLIETKYYHIQGIIDRKNFIVNDIMKLVNNDFVYNSKDNPKNGALIPTDENAIIEEVLNFYTLMIK